MTSGKQVLSRSEGPGCQGRTASSTMQHNFSTTMLGVVATQLGIVFERHAARLFHYIADGSHIQLRW